MAVLERTSSPHAFDDDITKWEPHSPATFLLFDFSIFNPVLSVRSLLTSVNQQRSYFHRPIRWKSGDATVEQFFQFPPPPKFQQINTCGNAQLLKRGHFLGQEKVNANLNVNNRVWSWRRGQVKGTNASSQNSLKKIYDYLWRYNNWGHLPRKFPRLPLDLEQLDQYLPALPLGLKRCS